MNNRKENMSEIDFEKDQQKIAENTDLSALSIHVEKIMDLDKQLEHQENVMKELKNQRDKISSETIPAILAEQGLQSLKLADGTVLEVNKKYSCTLPKDPQKKASAYQWLRDQGLGDIIKNEVAVTFGKGEDDKAQSLIDLAVANGYEPSQKSDVAWNTLTALYEERVKAGLDMPSDVFHLWIKDKTKISRK
jgi:hypothetical protein